MNQSEIFYGVVWKMVIYDGNASLSNATCLQTRILIDPPSYSVKYCGLWNGIVGLKEKKELEKIMMHYIKWLFTLDFCILKYVTGIENE